MSKFTVKELNPSSIDRVLEQIQQYESTTVASTSDPKKRVAQPATQARDGKFPESLTGVVSDEQFDRDILQKLGGPKLKSQRWTLGNSAGLVEGARRESLGVTLAWIMVPTLLGALLLAAMFHS